MGEDSITVEILKAIRDELRGMREAQEQTNARLDRTNERLDRVVQEQIRHATAIVGLEGRMGDVVDRVQLLGQGMQAMATELHGLNTRIDNVLTGPLGATAGGEAEATRPRLPRAAAMAPAAAVVSQGSSRCSSRKATSVARRSPTTTAVRGSARRRRSPTRAATTSRPATAIAITTSARRAALSS